MECVDGGWKLPGVQWQEEGLARNGDAQDRPVDGGARLLFLDKPAAAHGAALFLFGFEYRGHEENRRAGGENTKGNQDVHTKWHTKHP